MLNILFLRCIVVVLSSPALRYREFLSFASIQINNRRFLLSVLCIMTMFWANGCMASFLQNKSSKPLLFLVIALLFSLIIFFYISKVLTLYIMFELSVLPIFRIILGWGYQRERLDARLRLIFYTLTASMPLLIILLWTTSSRFCRRLNCISNISSSRDSRISSISIFCFIMAFAVKLPMFGVHIWLPKAHVEAPVFGSIILAAILLKLGSYGLWVFVPLVYDYSNLNIWLSVRIIGAVIISIICVRLRDIKIIIAYSSVRHMGLVLIALLIIQPLGGYGGLLLILAHGVRSSGIFLISYYIYKVNFSRRILLRKGILVWSGILPLLWFLVLITNIAAPPTFNLVAEILVISAVVGLRKLNILPLILIIVLGTAYSLIIYSASIQGTSILTNNFYKINSIEILNISNHLIWGFFLVVAISLANF